MCILFVSGIAVHANAEHLCVCCFEFGDISLIPLQFFRSTPGEGQDIESEDHILLAFEVTQFVSNRLAVCVDDSARQIEVGRRIANFQVSVRRWRRRRGLVGRRLLRRRGLRYCEGRGRRKQKDDAKGFPYHWKDSFVNIPVYCHLLIACCLTQVSEARRVYIRSSAAAKVFCANRPAFLDFFGLRNQASRIPQGASG